LALILALSLFLFIVYGQELEPRVFLPAVICECTPAPTRSAYPFTMDNCPIYTRNYANNAGCNWLGTAGQVFDLEGSPVPAGAYMIWVTESGVNCQTFTGSAPAYGPSGWEVVLNDQPRVATHYIQLFSPSGTPVSEVYEFSTYSSCNANLVLINFVQNH